MAAAAILDFVFAECNGMAACGTSAWSTRQPLCKGVPRPIATKLCSINRILSGGRRHVEFISYVSFGHVAYFRLRLATLLQNFINVAQSAAELLRFVVLSFKKIGWKMGHG